MTGQKYNWIVPLVIAGMCAVFAAVGILTWSVAVWPITVLVLVGLVVWLQTHFGHMDE